MFRNLLLFSFGPPIQSLAVPTGMTHDRLKTGWWCHEYLDCGCDRSCWWWLSAKQSFETWPSDVFHLWLIWAVLGPVPCALSLLTEPQSAAELSSQVPSCNTDERDNLSPRLRPRTFNDFVTIYAVSRKPPELWSWSYEDFGKKAKQQR